MKSIEFNDATDTAIMREVVALRRRPHENIVPLLSSFTQSSTESSVEIKSLNLLFPYADMDMERWLNLKETPIEYAENGREVQRMDLYKSTYALVSALAFLHRENADDGLSASHYDIKPKNILVSGKKWMIADFGLARLHSSVGGSETDGIGGLGSYDYHPPEYYNDDGTRAEKRHGRAFDVWAMGCIMLQVAVLIVSGWEKGRIEEFRRSRSELSTTLRRLRKRIDGEDSSFHNSLAAIDDWIGELQADGSPMLLQFLQIIIQMLRGDPKDRLASWEVELDLYELLYPDHSINQRLEVSKTRIPRKDKSVHCTAASMPLRRAALRGNAVRAICLLEAGWRLDSKHLNHKDSASFRITDPNNRASIWEALRRAHDDHKPNALSEFRKNVLTPFPIHAKEHNGFQINQGITSLEIDNFEETPLSNIGNQALLLERDSQRRTIVHRAALHNEYEMMRTLSDSPQWNEAVGLKDNYGRTCLHYASGRHSADGIVQFILQKSPSPIALVLEEDQWGQTALHIAAARGNFLIAKILLDVVDDKPALVVQEDANGKTPVQLAGSSGDSELRGYLWELRNLE